MFSEQKRVGIKTESQSFDPLFVSVFITVLSSVLPRGEVPGLSALSEMVLSQGNYFFLTVCFLGLIICIHYRDYKMTYNLTT